MIVYKLTPSFLDNVEHIDSPLKNVKASTWFTSNITDVNLKQKLPLWMASSVGNYFAAEQGSLVASKDDSTLTILGKLIPDYQFLATQLQPSFCFKYCKQPMIVSIMGCLGAKNPCPPDTPQYPVINVELSSMSDTSDAKI